MFCQTLGLISEFVKTDPQVKDKGGHNPDYYPLTPLPPSVPFLPCLYILPPPSETESLTARCLSHHQGYDEQASGSNAAAVK